MKDATTPILAANELAYGTHEGGQITFTASESINYPYRFVALNKDRKVHSARDNFACTKAPALGVVYDVCDDEDAIAVRTFGAASSTLLVRAADTITAGELISSNKEGEAIAVHQHGQGEFFSYGHALNSANEGQLVEFAPCMMRVNNA